MSRPFYTHGLVRLHLTRRRAREVNGESWEPRAREGMEKRRGTCEYRWADRRVRRCRHTRCGPRPRSTTTTRDERDKEGEMIMVCGMWGQQGAREGVAFHTQGGVMCLVGPIVVSDHALGTQQDLPQAQAQLYSMTLGLCLNCRPRAHLTWSIETSILHSSASFLL